MKRIVQTVFHTAETEPGIRFGCVFWFSHVKSVCFLVFPLHLIYFLNAFNVFYLNSFHVINLIVIRLQFVKLNPLRVFLRGKKKER